MATDNDAKQYLVRDHNGAESGPFNESALKLLAKNGRIGSEDLISLSGSGRWTKAYKVKGLGIERTLSLAEERDLWLYQLDGTAIGPVSRQVICQLLSGNKQGHDTPIRRTHEREWHPASYFSEFASLQTNAQAPATKTSARKAKRRIAVGMTLSIIGILVIAAVSNPPDSWMRLFNASLTQDDSEKQSPQIGQLHDQPAHQDNDEIADFSVSAEYESEGDTADGDGVETDISKSALADPSSAFIDYAPCFIVLVHDYQIADWKSRGVEDDPGSVLTLSDFDVRRTDSLLQPINGVIMGNYYSDVTGRYNVTIICLWDGNEWSPDSYSMRWTGEYGYAGLGPNDDLASVSVRLILDAIESGACP